MRGARRMLVLAMALAAGCTLIGGGADLSIRKGGSHSSTSSSGIGGGTGGGAACDPASCPGADTDCDKRACDANGQCTTEHVAQGTNCADANEPDAKVCDGQGNCVVCNDTADCTGSDLCAQNQCVPATCTDVSQNGSETDVDCGGQDCAPCWNTKMCNVAGDCASGFCDTSGGGGGAAGLCAACTNENDCQAQQWCDTADNGGTCKAQSGDGSSCGADIECQSGHCPKDDGVCCDTACGGLCEACQASKTGGTDGTCAPVTAGTDLDGDCTQDDTQCNTGNCSGTAGQCEAAASNVVCRAQSGGCDIEEMCDGSNKDCPPDGFKADGQPSTGGQCDPYLCDGNQAGCPSSCQQQGDCTPVPPYDCQGNVCCVSNGGSCNGNPDCCSGMCGPGNLCCVANSGSCSGNTDCCSGNCVGNVCMP